MRVVVQRFEADRGNLERFYTITISPTRLARLQRFRQDWSAGGNIPIAMVRALVRGQKLERDGPAGWKFYAPDVP